MSKFNKPQPTVKTGPIRTVAQDATQTQTFEGGPGYARDAKSELFLLAVTNMVGESTSYESGARRDDRFAALCRTVAAEDGLWFLNFVTWLRTKANMRSASLVAAAHGVNKRLELGLSAELEGGAGINRRIISAVLQRADEPGEFLAFWHAAFGRAEPKAVKRGVADAVARLYTEYSALKYDTASHAFRFADVLNRVHADEGSDALFQYIIDRRFGNEVNLAGLPMIAANEALRELVKTDPARLLDGWRLKQAGMTWEDVLSLAGDKLSKKALWEALIPTMGYMALLRNLRNFDEAGVSDKMASEVIAKLTDPGQVATSRQLPLRFLSAFWEVSNLRWAYPLEQALQHSLANVPWLGGSTLILVDTSGSMSDPLSAKSKLRRWNAAAMFGLAMGQRCEQADVVSFSTSSRQFTPKPAESLLSQVKRWKDGGFFLNGGTSTARAVEQHFARHDRVVILTDEQASYNYWGGPDPLTVLPAKTPLYTWNLAGYEHGHAPSGAGNSFTFGGLSDAAFNLVPLIEGRRDGVWPWETDN